MPGPPDRPSDPLARAGYKRAAADDHNKVERALGEFASELGSLVRELAQFREDAMVTQEQMLAQLARLTTAVTQMREGLVKGGSIPPPAHGEKMVSLPSIDQALSDAMDRRDLRTLRRDKAKSDEERRGRKRDFLNALMAALLSAVAGAYAGHFIH